MYLYQWTRPDLSFAVSFLSLSCQGICIDKESSILQSTAAKHTLRYLPRTKTLGIQYICDLNRLSSNGHDLNVMYGLLTVIWQNERHSSGQPRFTQFSSMVVPLLIKEWDSQQLQRYVICTAMAETIAPCWVGRQDQEFACFDDHRILQVLQNQETEMYWSIILLYLLLQLEVISLTRLLSKLQSKSKSFMTHGCVKLKIVWLFYVAAATRKNSSDMNSHTMTKQSAGPQSIFHNFWLGWVTIFSHHNFSLGTILF